LKNSVFLQTLLFLTIMINTEAQVQQEWVARFNNSNSDNLFSMCIDKYSNLYLTGRSEYSYCTIKYNSSGIEQWFREYINLQYNTSSALSVAVDSTGNVYVTGYSWGSGTGNDITTIKYNSSGTKQWLHRYTSPLNRSDYGNCIGVDSSGNVYVIGGIEDSQSNEDIILIKYNTNGIVQFISTYNGIGNSDDFPRAMKMDKFNNIYITGSTGGTTGSDFIIIKFNSEGIKQWVQQYNGPGNASDYANSIALDSSGNVYVTGESAGIGGGADYATLKYSSNGQQLWVQRYNDPFSSIDKGRSIAVGNSGSVYVTGESVYTAGYDYATIKYSSSGVQQWITRYNGPANNDDKASTLVIDNLENIYVTGSSLNIPSGTNTDCVTVKYDSSGVQQWLQTYNGPANGNDYGHFIAIDNYMNVFVSGSSGGIGSDIATIKYSQLVGINPVSSEIPVNYNLSQNYPNPFNPATNIKFQIPKTGFVKLIVYDIIGSEIAKLVNEQLSSGVYEVEWNAMKYPSGVYYYKLTSGEYTETKKMILIK
jgi:uncharacterized delta-60 repeat protein